MTIENPHSRLNPLTGEWVLVSPHRTTRPWLGQVEKSSQESRPVYEPDCYLCPGNGRAGGRTNPVYKSTFVFDNDFPSLLPIRDEKQSVISPDDRLFVTEPASGLCRVVCFSPRHDLTIAELSKDEVISIIQTWIDQTKELSKRDDIQYIQIFENKGEMMGCSNPHPHCQIWALNRIPNEPAKEYIEQKKYFNRNGTCLLCDYLRAENQQGNRLIYANQYFTALVPFWAVWPFEVLLVSNHHIGSFLDFNSESVEALADTMLQITIRYDNLFSISFPYSMGFHQVPCENQNHDEWHFHAHYYPPLLRSATVKKFMVGFEMLAMPQRDLTPEAAAERLRYQSPIHYKKSNDDNKVSQRKP